MKIAIATVQVPFMTGGAEILTKMLKDELVKRGHAAEIITIPFKWYPGESLVQSMMMGRMLDLTADGNGDKIDCVIAMKFPAFYVKHENKVIWMMHQHRSAYDLWNTKFGDLNNFPDGKELRDLIINCDNRYIREAKNIFTIAQNTSNRLLKYNNIASTVLYHPPLNHEKLYCKSYGDFIFYPSRISAIKRQRLLVEAAKYLKTAARIVLAGSGSETEITEIKKIIKSNHLEKRVTLAGFISEEQKIEYYATCLGVYFGAYDEDYGYITLEAFYAEKPVIVHKDAGGPLEFVENEVNGYVIEDEARQIAEKIDYLYINRKEAEEMGKKGRQSLKDKHMDWDYVIDHLLK